MSAKLSLEVTQCVRTGLRALSAFEVEGSRAAAAFLETTEPHGQDGDEAAHPDGFLTAVSRKLRAALDHLVATDFAVARTGARESRLRRQRKADKRQLALLIVALRRLVLACYVDPDLDNLGLQPVNVRDVGTVVRRAQLVGERFAAVNLARMLGEARFERPPRGGSGGGTLSPDLLPYVEEILAMAAELVALTDEINEARRASDRARIERNRAKDEYERVYLRGIRMFEDLCRFAGLDDLAATLRRRQPRSKASADKSDEDVKTASPRPPRADLAAPAERAGLRAADLPGAGPRAPAEIPEPEDRGSGQGPEPPSAAADPEALPHLLRLVRRERPGGRPEGAGAAGAGRIPALKEDRRLEPPP